MTTEHPIATAARAACEALTRALDTEKRAADEVENDGGQRTAQDSLQSEREHASVTIHRLAAVLPEGYRMTLFRMAWAVRQGYAREKWVLRIMQIAAEAAKEDGR